MAEPALYALLVGIDRYEPRRLPDGGWIPDLQACVNDVERMEAFLQAPPLSVPAERIRKLVAPGAVPAGLGGRPEPSPEELPTYRNLLRELEALGERAGAGDRILIHYSGHGARLPTVVPGKKGPGGRDECLVPCDAGKPEGGFLRDVELHEILRRLAARKVRATLILDCCHSGGVTRALARGNVRGLGEVQAPAPTESLLGSWEELAASLPSPLEETGSGPGGEAGHRSEARSGGQTPAQVFRNLSAEAGWFPQPEGCVLLAACRPTELAREYPFEGGTWSGALTHFLLLAVGDLGSRPTYRRLHHRLLGRIRTLFDTQTPLLEGDGDLRFLGRDTWPARRGIGVLAVEGEGAERRVQLAAGRAQGLGKGARLGVADREGPGDGAGKADREPRAELEVTKLGATTSWARVVGDEANASKVEPGSLATVIDPGKGARAYPVRVFRPPLEAPTEVAPGTSHGSGQTPGQPHPLDRLQQILAPGPHPLLTLISDGASDGEDEAGPEAEYQVEVTANGCFQILDPSGEPVPHQGRAIPANEPDATDRLLERLAHLASYRERARLDNPDPSSPLHGKLRAALHRLDSIDDWQDPDSRQRLPEGATVPEGTLLCLLVRNDSPRELNFAVLDLQPDWGITRVHPGPGEGEYTVLDPNQEHPVFLKAGLPDWMQEGRDRLKVIATTGPLDAASLELDALGASAGFRGGRTGHEPPGLLDRLFNPAGPDTGLRTVQKVTPASHEWVVETVDVVVAQGARG